MKRFLSIITFLLFSLLASAEDYNILVFGHSFAQDCTEYLPLLLAEEGIDNVRVARIVKANCSLKERYDFFLEDNPDGYAECKPGSVKFIDEPRTFRQAVSDRAWDVIVFQNSLEGEGQYGLVQPYLRKMVRYIRKVQKKEFGNTPRFCWNMFWPISRLLENSEKEPHHTRMEPYGHNTENAYKAYVATARRIRSAMGFEIIPSGTAIMKLRASSLNTPEMKEFTRDGYHMSHGAGRYAAACVWFRYLITPKYKISVFGNTLRMPDAESPVTDANAAALQQAALDAVADPFNGIEE